METLTLQLIFLTEDALKYTINITDPDDNLTADDIEGAMNIIVNTNSISLKGGKLIKSLSARFVTRTVETYFDNKN